MNKFENDTNFRITGQLIDQGKFTLSNVDSDNVEYYHQPSLRDRLITAAEVAGKLGILYTFVFGGQVVASQEATPTEDPNEAGLPVLVTPGPQVPFVREFGTYAVSGNLTGETHVIAQTEHDGLRLFVFVNEDDKIRTVADVAVTEIGDPDSLPTVEYGNEKQVRAILEGDGDGEEPDPDPTDEPDPTEIPGGDNQTVQLDSDVPNDPPATEVAMVNESTSTLNSFSDREAAVDYLKNNPYPSKNLNPEAITNEGMFVYSTFTLNNIAVSGISEVYVDDLRLFDVEIAYKRSDSSIVFIKLRSEGLLNPIDFLSVDFDFIKMMGERATKANILFFNDAKFQDGFTQADSVARFPSIRNDRQSTDYFEFLEPLPEASPKNFFQELASLPDGGTVDYTDKKGYVSALR